MCKHLSTLDEVQWMLFFSNNKQTNKQIYRNDSGHGSKNKNKSIKSDIESENLEEQPEKKPR